ncbi:MAG: hypothetical protein ACYDC9_09810 [Dermatophilaceae bacterium]
MQRAGGVYRATADIGGIWGFVGAKIYDLHEQLSSHDMHHLGGMGGWVLMGLFWATFQGPMRRP